MLHKYKQRPLGCNPPFRLSQRRIYALHCLTPDDHVLQEWGMQPRLAPGVVVPIDHDRL